MNKPTSGSLESHEAAGIFPLMSGTEYDGLVADIAANGLREPVWLHRDGRIIDGRNRYRACIQLGIDPPLRTYDGPDEGLVAFVVSMNLHRRHLDSDQRAIVAARIANLGEGRPAKTTEISAVSQDDAAELLKVSADSIQFAKRVLASGDEDLIREAEKGRKEGGLSVSAAAAAAKLETAKRKEFLARAEKDRTARQARQMRRDAEDAAQAVADYIGDGRSNAQRMQASESDEWYTPAGYIEAARRVLGAIDLDPASSPQANATVKAARFFTKDDDGLAERWKGRVWLNPPYGGAAGPFIARLAEHVASGEVTAAVALVSSHSVDTAWFRPLWDWLLCFTYGRIQFTSSDGRGTEAATHGSVFAYAGPDPDAFLAEFSGIGAVMTRYALR